MLTAYQQFLNAWCSIAGLMQPQRFVLGVLFLCWSSSVLGQTASLPLTSHQLESEKQAQLESKHAYKATLRQALIERPQELLEVTMTAYSSTVDQTDDTPFITATQQPVRLGIVAVSRDLLAEHLPYGTILRVVATQGAPDSCGAWALPMLLEVQDTMHRRKRNQIDLWLPSRQDALSWGYCQASVEIIEVPPTTPTQTHAPHASLSQRNLVIASTLASSWALLQGSLSAAYMSHHLVQSLEVVGMVLPDLNAPSPNSYLTPY